ncbi:tethering factor for nuclear proteasome STS1-like isoform X2 [Chlorella sorokiniana]|uniref:Tethering factor for nuclear proteasome STS1-like isoform X2 n=1 Tax=Chlorella sorokiniana TaxID=3076 RepID=A0A2P6THY1_CHLSO|nr:tethering factor for nuclear proteasome STS1-like isoform X2 [Chlorella sorokiniana]|eukprot:PRW33887.1 tethering factor for nuclear proteasome STS1-like isoform X2 [Chlorella sorokiniana]
MPSDSEAPSSQGGASSGEEYEAASREPSSSSPPPAKRPRAGPQPKLTDLLKSASKEQLVSLVVHLNDDAGGELEGRISALLPPPDLSRVGPPLRDLKAALLEHGRMLAECKRFGALLDYSLFALGVTDSMPHWDADAHNKPKLQAAKALEGLLVKALKAAAPTPDQRAQVLQQLERLELPLQAARAALGAA